MRGSLERIATLTCLAVFTVVAAQAEEIDNQGIGLVDAAMPDEAEVELARGVPLTVSVVVDGSYCATDGAQCFSADAPSPSNRNPVRLGIQVTDDAGMPVMGLPSSAFRTHNNFVPAYASSIARNPCSNCFQRGLQGLYTIFVNPDESRTWHSGSYFVQVEVSDGPLSGRALAAIEIPF
jgi:hypothetical protein